jgi:hypothetical protein
MDTFTRRVEAFSSQKERFLKVTKELCKEIITRVGLPRSLQGDDRHACNSQITQAITRTLGITYHVFTS